MTDIIDLDPSAAEGVSDVGLERPAALPTKKALVVTVKTKAEFFDTAKDAIERGHHCFREAAEALGAAKEHHGATQREMAKTVGMSVAWVNRLLKWRRMGYGDASPFGPTTKQGRVQHAERRNRTIANEAVVADHQMGAPQRVAPSSQEIEEIKLAIGKLDDHGRLEIFSYINQIMKSSVP
jgi:hypothetical protein